MNRVFRVSTNVNRFTNDCNSFIQRNHGKRLVLISNTTPPSPPGTTRRRRRRGTGVDTQAHLRKIELKQQHNFRDLAEQTGRSISVWATPCGTQWSPVCAWLESLGLLRRGAAAK
jgi:hypothetical protein